MTICTPPSHTLLWALVINMHITLHMITLVTKIPTIPTVRPLRTLLHLSSVPNQPFLSLGLLNVLAHMLYTKKPSRQNNKPVEARVDGWTKNRDTVSLNPCNSSGFENVCFISHSLTDDGEQIWVNGLTLITTRAYTSQSSLGIILLEKTMNLQAGFRWCLKSLVVIKKQWWIDLSNFCCCFWCAMGSHLKPLIFDWVLYLHVKVIDSMALLQNLASYLAVKILAKGAF